MHTAGRSQRIQLCYSAAGTPCFVKPAPLEETDKPNSSLTLFLHSHVIRLIIPHKEEIKRNVLESSILLSTSPTDLPRNACIIVFPHSYKGFNAVTSSVVPPNRGENCVLFFPL